jgi:amidase
MTFRVVLTLVLFSLVLPMFTQAQATRQRPDTKVQLLPEPYFESIAQLQGQLRTGKITSVQITQDFILRIEALDQNGPRVNSVIELNPDALKIAQQRDLERKAGHAHGLLFGIPVMVKDNMDTADRMQTTAGSLALVGPPASRDATIVAKLRAAGAILLGKTNLSEWANFRSSYSTSGWSGRGGLTRNPYALDRNACGSSSGSGVAVSAGFVTVSLGTETDGSLTCPASVNGLVDIKPTLGLVSRAGIVPISHSQDDPGPMARSVSDAAAVLTVIAGSDPRDPATAEADKYATDYTRFLKPGELRNKRIGVVCGLAGFDPNVDRILDRSVAALRAAGARVIPVKLPHLHDYGKAELTVLLYEFRHDLDAYLSTRKGLKVKTLANIIAFDHRHAQQEMPWFGQDLFNKAEAKGPLTDKAYTEALAKEKRLTGPEGIDAALKADRLNALMAPASGAAWSTDLVNGDHSSGGGDSPAAVAGYPSITVPAGNVHGLPVGVVFFAGKWSEPILIGIAYDFEQATRARIRPHFLASVPLAEQVPSVAKLDRDSATGVTAVLESAQPARICPGNAGP